MKLKPRFLSMIVPSRWFSGGKGLDDFRDRHIKYLRYKKIVDFFDSNDCFPGVKIEGGVNYFLWERDYQGECEVKSIYKGEVVSVSNRKLSTNGSDIFIRQNEGVDIYKKILKKSTNFFNKIVSPQKPFGLRTFIVPEDNKTKNSIVLYGNKKIGYYDVNKIESNKEWIPKFKVFISMAYGVGKSIPQQVLNKPILGYPGSACTETYVLIGPFETKTTAENVLNYIQTKFFRYLVSLRKNTQHASQSVYSFVPLLDYSIGWTDEMLFSYFDLSSTEIELINNSIKDMSNKENSEEEEI
jgi:site-specific DNA-methyltransferase (adenine-specific)